jgi:hypothetical protein
MSTFLSGCKKLSATAATIFVACTSKPTTVLAFAMAGSCYAVVDAAWVPPARLRTHTNASRGTGHIYSAGRTTTISSNPTLDERSTAGVALATR